MQCSLRVSKARLVSDGYAMSHKRMFGISVRFILTMSDGERDSTFGGVSEGAGLGCLEGGVTKGVGLGYLVGG